MYNACVHVYMYTRDRVQFGCSPSLFSVVAISTDQNHPGRLRKVLFGLHITVNLQGKGGRNSFRHLEEGIEAKTMKGYCLLTLSPWLLSLLPYTTQDLLPRGDSVQWAKPSHIISNEENFSHDMSTGKHDGLPQLRFSLPRCV